MNNSTHDRKSVPTALLAHRLHSVRAPQSLSTIRNPFPGWQNLETVQDRITAESIHEATRCVLADPSARVYYIIVYRYRPQECVWWFVVCTVDSSDACELIFVRSPTPYLTWYIYLSFACLCVEYIGIFGKTECVCVWFPFGYRHRRRSTGQPTNRTHNAEPNTIASKECNALLFTCICSIILIHTQAIWIWWHVCHLAGVWRVCT